MYYFDFNTTGFSDDTYFIRSTSATGVNVPQEGELVVGGYVDEVTEMWKERGLDSASPVTRTETSTSWDSEPVEHTVNPEISITSTRQ